MGNFRSIADKYTDRGEQTNIAIGLRPSGVVHLGNLVTLGLAGLLGREIGPHLSKVNVTVCDLDLPGAGDWSVRDSGYVKYFDSIKDPHGCHNSLLDHSSDGLNEYVSNLEETLDIYFDIRKLSDVQREESFREGLKKVLDTPGAIQYILPRVPEGKVLAFPICSSCNTSNPDTPDYKNGNLVTSCANPNCSIDEYDVDVLDCDKDIAVHFFIDPIRDKTVKPYIDVHVFGGDYKEVHYTGGIRDTGNLIGLLNPKNKTKLDKILKIMDIASEGFIPDVLLGPTIYANDGYKMSKSTNNGLSMDRLREHFGEEYTGKIVNLLDYLILNDIKNVDFTVVEKKLFE